MRARVAGWLRRAVIVVLALAVIKVFEACFASILVGAPGDLHAAVHWFRDAIRGIPVALHRLSVPRPVEIGFLTPLERFMLGLAMLLFATRLVIRTKLLDAVYVTSVRWQERTVSGLVLHSFALVVQAGLLAWAASSARTPDASDGLACGLIVADALGERALADLAAPGRGKRVPRTDEMDDQRPDVRPADFPGGALAGADAGMVASGGDGGAVPGEFRGRRCTWACRSSSRGGRAAGGGTSRCRS